MLRAAQTLALAVLAACVTPSPAPAAPREPGKGAPLRVGISASLGVAATAQNARLVKDFLAKGLGLEVELKLFPTYDALTYDLAAGVVDVALMPPLAYVRASRLSKVMIVRKTVRHGVGFYSSVLFVSAASPYKAVEDLSGARIAWGPKESASGYVFPRAWLSARGIDPKWYFASQTNLRDHAAVCRAVAEGKADVGATFANDSIDLSQVRVDGCLPEFAGKLGKFRIVFQSDPIPNDVVAARAGLSTELVGRLGVLLDALKPGDPVLKDGFRCEGFRSGGEGDFLGLRRAATHVPVD